MWRGSKATRMGNLQLCMWVLPEFYCIIKNCLKIIFTGTWVGYSVHWRRLRKQAFQSELQFHIKAKWSPDHFWYCHKIISILCLKYHNFHTHILTSKIYFKQLEVFGLLSKWRPLTGHHHLPQHQHHNHHHHDNHWSDNETGGASTIESRRRWKTTQLRDSPPNQVLTSSPSSYCLSS